MDDFSEASLSKLGTDDKSGRKNSERHYDMEAAMEAVQSYVLTLAGPQSWLYSLYYV